MLGTLDIAFFVILLLSAVFHEYMHAWMSNELGDPTARNLGRLTLNPIPHIDPFMTLILPATLYWATSGAFMFAAAKPVPFNPYNLKFPKWGPALVGLSGPMGNFALAILFASIFRFVPLPEAVASIVAMIVYTNVLLGIFNLVPIPPLDGSHVLTSMLPPKYSYVEEWLHQYGIYIFIFFVLFLVDLIFPLIRFANQLLLGI